MPTICSCWNAVFLSLHTWTRTSTGFNKKRLSSDLIFHPIWSRAHWSLAVLWRFVNSGRFIGLLARNLAMLKRLLMVRLLMRPLTIHRLASQRVCSAEWLLLWEPCKESTFSWGRFHRPSCPLPFFYTSGLVHALLQSNNDRVAYIELFSNMSVWYTTPYHSNCLPSLCIWQFSTCHVDIKFRKLKVLYILYVQILVRNPRQTWVLWRYNWTDKSLFRRSLINWSI